MEELPQMILYETFSEWKFQSIITVNREYNS